METCAYCGRPVMPSEFTPYATGTTKDGRHISFDFCSIICLDGWILRTHSQVGRK